MTEAMPPYMPLRQPEYFILKTEEKIFRLRVPWLCVQAIISIIESPQGPRSHPISWNHMPGPAIERQISIGAAVYIFEWARGEGWIE